MNQINWKAILFGIGLAIGFLVLIFSLYLAWQGVLGLLDDQEVGPCQESSVEIRCYNLAKENCRTVWETYEGQCKAEIKSQLDPKKVTSLIGPQVRGCTYRSLDQALRSTRKMVPADQRCLEHFQKMDAPRVD